MLSFGKLVTSTVARKYYYVLKKIIENIIEQRIIVKILIRQKVILIIY